MNTINYILFISLLCWTNISKFSIHQTDSTDRSGSSIPYADTLVKLSESSLSTSFGGDVALSKITSGQENIGNIVWLYANNKHIKTKYFADKGYFKSVYARYQDWKKNKKVILFCTGGFNATGYPPPPLGLTIDNGKVINEKIEANMDGMLVEYPANTISIYDLDKGISIFSPSIDPRKSLQKQELISWAKGKYATLFQSHLLVSNNVLKCNYVNSLAERRFLVEAKNSSGNIVYAICSANKSVTLWAFAKAISAHFRKTKKMTVNAMINLDTGGQNIFQMFDDKGKDALYIKKGIIAPEDALNLLVYYYE